MCVWGGGGWGGGCQLLDIHVCGGELVCCYVIDHERGMANVSKGDVLHKQ